MFRDLVSNEEAAKERPHGRPAGSTRRRTRRDTGTAGQEAARRQGCEDTGQEDTCEEDAGQEGPGAEGASKKAPAKKAPAKKAPATKPPAQSPEPAEPAPQPTALANVSQQQPSANGQLAEAAKDAAAQAKSTVDRANNPLPRVADEQPSHSTVPLVVAIALSLLAMLLIRQLRRR